MAAPVTRAARDAVIVLPGMVKLDDFSVGAVARRLAVAMDNSAPARASFRVADARTVKCGTREHSVVTIHRRDHGEDQALVDVYEFDYHHALTELQERDTPLRQVLAMAVTLVFATPSLFGALRRPSQRLADKLQLWCGALLFIVILLYFGTLAWTVIGSLLATLPSSWSDWLAHLQTHFSKPRLGIVKSVLLTLTLLASGTRLNVRAALAKIGPAFSCSCDYLTAGKRRSQIIGELARLLDYLDERGGSDYRRVHVLAYSFGSVIALDALFPRETKVIPRLQRVNSFVSIGCSFDFIRTYWPRYFERRHAGTAPRRWLNIYCELDIFGSNFMDETDRPAAERQRGIQIHGGETRHPTTNLSFGPTVEERGSRLDYAKLIGFRAHSMYWDRDSEEAISCFGPIVDFLWPEHAFTPRAREVA